MKSVPGGGSSAWGQVDILLHDQSASQPAIIGQATSHVTKCQPNPKSDPGGGFICHACHFTHYLFQAFTDKKYVKNINIKREIGL